MQQRRVTWSSAWPLAQVADADIGDYPGVYLLWRSTLDGPIVLYAGQTDNMANRLARHRYNFRRKRYEVFVGWAYVPYDDELGGIEAYLARCYRPVYGQRFPDAIPSSGEPSAISSGVPISSDCLIQVRHAESCSLIKSIMFASTGGAADTFAPAHLATLLIISVASSSLMISVSLAILATLPRLC